MPQRVAIGRATTLASVALLVAVLVVGYLAVTNTSKASCPILASFVPPPPLGNFSTKENHFTVEVSFQGPWNATVQTFSAFDKAPTHLKSTCHYAGSGVGFIFVAPWNPNGEQTVAVDAHKLDSSDGNMTASVTWGAAHC